MNIQIEDLASVLDKSYKAALRGISERKTCYDLANEYTKKHADIEIAIDNFVKWQVAKCTTSGFVTSLGGIITLPVAIPANLATVWYVQLRMIATIALISGHDPSDDAVQTLAYMCITGTSISKICKEAGIKAGEKFTLAAIKKLPVEIIYKINRIAMQRLITKSGTTGVINLTKMVPVVGGVIGGGFDYVGTKAIAARAKKIFLKESID